MHVIDCIGNHEPINSTAIAEKMELSKASITKIGSKLLEDGLVKRSQLKENKKEIYFRLTPKGKKIFDLHQKMHQIEADRFYRFLSKYAESDLVVVRNFLQDLGTKLEHRLEEQ
ncbi:MarR family transcriptional regulator [Paenibacillus eucommiae]|uniref:DNA-binding MarR family transcriptional regulator n=1 Tax=Paenibacillus eucommiae TaxID=1355755 RepID=A0ABS4ITH0_9BACL|nr:MarR family transcriptional regulator [Paenibacillus eucommiae]MBP1990176.1 DNA-binding MarR family transcriptional regulator [Paenibacillus eucommiae]